MRCRGWWERKQRVREMKRKRESRWMIASRYGRGRGVEEAMGLTRGLESFLRSFFRRLQLNSGRMEEGEKELQLRVGIAFVIENDGGKEGLLIDMRRHAMAY
ncbi:hypothetical protein M5K25_020124 [Dendrobium thyrsiflorum]|uniref:Uncharacterized protein n=1 Tax=Dendrobium thyrsiflorum TaxID=117978 RepID=A0ABD0U983_DENTH